jgi:hypothetical protein
MSLKITKVNTSKSLANVHVTVPIELNERFLSYLLNFNAVNEAKHDVVEHRSRSSLTPAVGSKRSAAGGEVKAMPSLIRKEESPVVSAKVVVPLKNLAVPNRKKSHQMSRVTEHAKSEPIKSVTEHAPSLKSSSHNGVTEHAGVNLQFGSIPSGKQWRRAKESKLNPPPVVSSSDLTTNSHQSQDASHSLTSEIRVDDAAPTVRQDSEDSLLKRLDQMIAEQRSDSNEGIAEIIQLGDFPVMWNPFIEHELKQAGSDTIKYGLGRMREFHGKNFPQIDKMGKEYRKSHQLVSHLIAMQPTVSSPRNPHHGKVPDFRRMDPAWSRANH